MIKQNELDYEAFPKSIQAFLNEKTWFASLCFVLFMTIISLFQFSFSTIPPPPPPTPRHAQGTISGHHPIDVWPRLGAADHRTTRAR